MKFLCILLAFLFMVASNTVNAESNISDVKNYPKDKIRSEIDILNDELALSAVIRPEVIFLVRGNGNPIACTKSPIATLLKEPIGADITPSGTSQEISSKARSNTISLPIIGALHASRLPSKKIQPSFAVSPPRVWLLVITTIRPSISYTIPVPEIY